jgi:hypothetical protein
LSSLVAGCQSGSCLSKPARSEDSAVLEADYRQLDGQGRLDFEKTVQVLRNAESFMDAASLLGTKVEASAKPLTG